MGQGIHRKPGATTLVARSAEARPAGALSPGKRTLTEQLTETRPIQRKAAGGADVSRAAVQAHVDRASHDGGGSLPGGLRRELEPALGADLSSVRVHTGTASASAADALQAKAYAVGQDIHFGAGAYDPSSQSGKHLIAQEVAHTVQQGGAPAGVQRARVEPSLTIKRF